MYEEKKIVNNWLLLLENMKSEFFLKKFWERWTNMRFLEIIIFFET